MGKKKQAALKGTPENKVREREEFINRLDKAEVVEVVDLKTGKVLMEEGSDREVVADVKLLPEGEDVGEALPKGQEEKIDPSANEVVGNGKKRARKKPEKMTKNLAFCMAMKEGGTQVEIIDRMKKQFAKGTGKVLKSDDAICDWWARDAMLILRRLDLLKDKHGVLSVGKVE